MNIQEAVKEAVEKDKYIKRNTTGVWEVVKIKPTNSSDNCIVEIIDDPRVKTVEPKAQRRGWQPMALDLMEDDWIVVD